MHLIYVAACTLPFACVHTCMHMYMYILIVTVYGKTRHMGFFVKVEFDASMISSTIELTRVQVLD